MLGWMKDKTIKTNKHHDASARGGYYGEERRVL